MAKQQIKSRSRTVLYECEAESIRDALELAVRVRANLAGANLAYAYLARADLADAYLARAGLAYAYLARANLAGANLAYAYLARAYLADANMAYAYLDDAYLARADLTGANLAGANLAGADLAYAYLAGANLAGAYLAGAYLAGADLTDAALTDAKGLRREAMPAAAELRAKVARKLREHPELHDQGDWGDGSADPNCGTPCCVAGWACHLGGGAYGLSVPTAATILLWQDGKPMPDFGSETTREEILAALEA